jgi:hypothetical protein
MDWKNLDGRDDKVIDAYYRAHNAESGIEELFKKFADMEAMLASKSKAVKATVADTSAKDTE